KPPTGLQPAIDPENVPSLTAPDPSGEPAAPSLDMMITKSMLYAAALKHGVNPYLVMGLAWHESGWQAAVVSSAGAVGIMQVMAHRRPRAEDHLSRRLVAHSRHADRQLGHLAPHVLDRLPHARKWRPRR